MQMTWCGSHDADDMVWGHDADDMVWGHDADDMLWRSLCR